MLSPSTHPSLPTSTSPLRGEDSVSLRDRVTRHKLDLALLFEAEPAPGVLRAELFRQQLFLLHADLVQQPAALSLARIAELPLILPAAPSAVRRLLDREFAVAGLTPKVIAEIHDFSSAIAAVKAGIGPAIAPIGDLSSIAGADGLIATPIECAIELTASLACAEDASLSPAAEAVRSLLLPFIKRYIHEHQMKGTEPLQQLLQPFVGEPSPLQMAS